MQQNTPPANGASTAELGQHPKREDAISRSKRILELVDIYIHRQDRQNRTALRVALMTEFDAAAEAERERWANYFFGVSENWRLGMDRETAVRMWREAVGEHAIGLPPVAGRTEAMENMRAVFVEFIQKAPRLVTEEDDFLTVRCATVEQAMLVEALFHSAGWVARVVALESVRRVT